MISLPDIWFLYLQFLNVKKADDERETNKHIGSKIEWLKFKVVILGVNLISSTWIMTVPWCCFSGLVSIWRRLFIRDRQHWASRALWFNLRIRAWFPFSPFQWTPRLPARHLGLMSRNTSYHYSPCTIPKPFRSLPSSLVLYQLCCQSVRMGSFWDRLDQHSQ